MHLQQAIADIVAREYTREATSDVRISGMIMQEIERFLKHNGYEKAANALHSEHMP